MALIGAGLTAPSFLPHCFQRNYKITRVSARRTRLPAMHKKSGIEIETASNALEDDSVIERLSIKDYLEQTKDLIKSDGGPPRWFSPLECGARWENSPLLLYLPGIDGVGLGLIMHHQKLGKIFDIWCLHIPVMDRTPFIDLVQYVKKTVQSENSNSPCRPIYLIGESFGGCLALAVASRNPDIDLMLILANPATSFRKSPLQALLPLLEVIPEQLNVGFPSMLNFITGDALTMVITSVKKGIPIQQTVQELSEGVAALFPSLSVLSDILPGKSILWKLRMLQSASSFANSRLHAVKSEVLILASGRDQLLPSKEEAERLGHLLPSCQIRNFKDSAHTLFLKEGADLVTVIKSAGFYRRTRNVDYVADFIKPTTSEFRKASESYRWFDVAASPMMLSTLENGRIVKGLAGIPFEGPVLLVGYHMLLGLEISPLIYEFWGEKNIKLRGMVHPRFFEKELERCLHGTTPFDIMRILGGVPVSAPNFYRLLSKKSHIFLYPGGSREALHRKGEEYKLFWPPQSEFVRMAARFGAKIVPFGVVGIDDMFDLFLDCNDQMKIPYFKAQIEHLNGGRRIRTEATGQFAKQVLHIPGVMPKLPGRFYFLFGKPIETEVRKEELRNREEAHELYMHIKHEVENCIGYLKEKREKDPYRSLASRILYKAIHGFESKVPTFEL